MQTITQNDIFPLLDAASQIMQQNRDFLIDLDGKVGDGDLGLTMTKAFAAAAEYASANPGVPGTVLMRSGMAIAKAAPSTMGTLMATGFMRGGKALGDTAELGTGEYLTFWQAFLQGLMERGKAQRNDKTLIDALAPAVDALEAASAGGLSLEEAAKAALAGAEQGLENTKNMVAKHGKAACFGEKGLGLQDAGATVIVLLMRSWTDLICA